MLVLNLEEEEYNIKLNCIYSLGLLKKGGLHLVYY